MAWVFCCKNGLRPKSRNSEKLPSVTADSLDPLELQVAEITIIKKNCAMQCRVVVVVVVVDLYLNLVKNLQLH